MRKFFWVLAVLLIVFAVGALGMLYAETAGPVQAGVAAVVKGEVKATTPPEKTARTLKSGDEIFMGDKIETGQDGQLQVLLLDQTVFTLGPLSAVTVDEFIYDPSKEKGKAGVAKGVLRALTSKVTRKQQDNAAEAEDLLNTEDGLDQVSREAAQTRAQSSTR